MESLKEDADTSDTPHKPFGAPGQASFTIADTDLLSTFNYKLSTEKWSS